LEIGRGRAPTPDTGRRSIVPTWLLVLVVILVVLALFGGYGYYH
jgi:hypothetical protein